MMVRDVNLIRDNDLGLRATNRNGTALLCKQGVISSNLIGSTTKIKSEMQKENPAKCGVFSFGQFYRLFTG
jgi:hypothetical protein